MSNNGLDLAALVDEQHGLVSMKAYADWEVFRVEQERVFGRAWLYVGHDTEVPRNGDYVTRQMSQDPVILTRDNHGQLRVFLNMCPHRGA
ncbi:Rieske 2Fe-2S domain-containing protein, partial [Immundisolibacter sp.]|uniref:Rieske 2Fe-2S domain-containing protein n=1 Tax=Immundisolibacter sp. TaxID=1934948 RepID=UPI003563DB7C